MTKTVVVGGGIAGLVAARSAARAGADVTVLEAAERLGGSVAAVDLAGLRVDAGAESFATRGTAVSSLIAELGLEVVPTAATAAQLVIDGRLVPAPPGVLGIPADPGSDAVNRAIGEEPARRAALDVELPEPSDSRDLGLGALVRRRMGDRVLDLLVRPVVEGVYGVDPDDADIDVILPGLRGALAREGALSRAVARLRASMPAGAAVAGIRGGMHRLVEALVADLDDSGVEVATNESVIELERDGDRWQVRTAQRVMVADRVVLASDGDTARRLLTGVIPHEFHPGWASRRETNVALLAVDAPELDGTPRGTGLLVSGGGPGSPSALTHSSAKWPWLAELLPPSRHLLRLTYPGAVTPDSDTARADAERLLGISLSRASVVDFATRTWSQDAPRARTGTAEKVHRITSALAEVPGVTVTGAWISGTGLAAVIPHASDLD